MNFRISTLADKNQVENLWAYCFEPREDPFFRWYFTHYYRPEQVLIGEENGVMCCVTHLNPYRLVMRGIQVNTSYVVGLATHPAARSQGVGKQLLQATLEEMRKKQEYVQILMPSHAGFYQPYGYELYCHQWQETRNVGSLCVKVPDSLQYAFISSPEQWRYLASVYEQYTQGLSGYAIRDEVSWRSHIAAQLAEGYIVVCFMDKMPISYAFYRIATPMIQCGEFIYTSFQGKKGLLHYMYNHRSQGEILQWNEGLHDQSYRFYSDGKKGHQTIPFMTCRIVDVKGALEMIPYPAEWTGEIIFHIKDPLVAWNGGNWKLQVNNGQGHVKRTEDTPTVEMSVGALGMLIFGTVSAKALAYNEKIHGNDEAILMLDKLFPVEHCFINEWY